MHLCDAIEAAVLAAPHAPANAVLALGQEGEGERPDPAHHLAALLLVAVLQQLMLRDHSVLHHDISTVGRDVPAPFGRIAESRIC